MEPNTPPEKPTVQSSDSGETPAPTNNPEPKKPAPVETVTPVEKSRASVSSPAGHGTYRVQAGTFANKTSADNLAADLSERGYRAEVKTVILEDRTLYRVQVGEYKSRTSADQVSDKLKGEGYSPTVSRAD
jgi:cell division protein FtsN